MEMFQDGLMLHHRAVAALVIFVLTYAGLAVGHGFYLKLDRTAIALLGGIAVLATGCLTLDEAIHAVNMPSILFLFGLMVIASQLHFAGFYQYAAGLVARTLDRPALFMALLMGVGGGLSAFLNNSVVVLAFVPVITPALLRSRLNPTPFLIALALAANIGCGATTVGNAQNVLLGQMGHLNFGRYLLFALPPVWLSLGAAYGICYFLGRRYFRELPEKCKASDGDEELPLNRWRTTKGIGILLIMVVLLITTHIPGYLLALTGAGLLLCSKRLESAKVLSLVNWQLLVLFIGLFVVVGGFLGNGFGQDFAAFLQCSGINLQDPVTVVWCSALLSNCINNAATVMLLGHFLDFSQLLPAYALALGNSFAGNFLLTGSLTNLIAAQYAEHYGIRISFGGFARYGMPTALVSLLILVAYLRLYEAL